MEQSDETGRVTIQLNKLDGSLQYTDLISEGMDGHIFWVCNKDLEKRIITVNVLTVSGASFPVRADPLSTVHTVKVQLADIVQIPSDTQFLYRDDADLDEDNKAISCCDITDGSVLHVVAHRELDVLVAVAGAETRRMKMKNTELVRKVVTRAASSSHSLWWGDHRLNPERALCIYTGDAETVQLEAGVGWLQLKVWVSSGEAFSMRATPANTVADIKTRAREKLGAAWKPDDYLTYRGDVLEEARSLTEYGVVDGGVLKLVGKDSIRVFVKTLNDKKYPVICDVTDTILSVKRDVQEVDGAPPDSQRLLFRGKRLEDDRSLVYYGIEKDDIIFLNRDISGGGPPPLFVLDRTGRSVKVRVYPYDTLEEVKARIEQLVGIPPEEQELVIYDERIMGKRKVPKFNDDSKCSLI